MYIIKPTWHCCGPCRLGDEAFGLGFFTPNFPGSPPPGLDSSLLPETKEEIYELLTSFHPTDIHANRNMPLNENHTRARARALPFFLPPAGWSMTKLLAAHVEGGRCFEILDREFLATHRDFALIRYTFSFVSIERAIKRVFLRRLRLMEDWLRSFFAIGRIYLMADWPVNVDRWTNDPEYRSGKKCRTCFKCKLISLNWKKEKKVFFLLLRTFILLDSFCSLIILISPFFKN